MPKAVFILYINKLSSQMPEEPKVQFPLVDVEKLRGLGPPGSGFSIADQIELLFSETARAKKHNKKHANAWKTYNQY
jgi:hypothetical protein